MTGMSSMSPFTGSGFRSGKARSSERRCWDCRKPMDTTTRLVRCGHCHDRRMATIAERRGGSDVTPPAHTDGCPPTTTTTKEPRP